MAPAEREPTEKWRHLPARPAPEDLVELAETDQPQPDVAVPQPFANDPVLRDMFRGGAFGN
jgi:hypothetical protein